MQTQLRNPFVTIRTVGSILPTDILQRISEGDSGLKGLSPKDYHLVEGEKLNEFINRSWNRLLGAWKTFQSAASKLSDSELGTGLTRERWLLVLFNELGYGRLPVSKAIEMEGKTYPVSHMWQNFPIHLVGLKIELDKKIAGVAGAARTSPHSMVQEFLNQSDDHLWAFVSNGLVLRILRDNASLTRQAYVEFDLKGMMEGEVYPDFVLLWLLCHQSRVEAERPEECWLEKWSRNAREQGTRALDQLRNGVEKAINFLGSGFVSHPANGELREKLRKGELNAQDYYRQILRIVYRLLFLFVAEDRELLNDPNSDIKARERYIRYYSTRRLRRMAQRLRGTKHSDLWFGVQLIFDKLDEGCKELGLPALGSFLWDRDAIGDLAYSQLSNRSLLDAIRELAYTVEQHSLRPVDYKNLGPEELGSVYESLLEFHPKLNLDAGTFELRVAAGNERKSTGSYYTPESLIQCLLDSALDPVVENAVKSENPEKTILDLKICDPAAGSGHFLIAAAHRIARRLAAVRTGDDEPSPEAIRSALRDVISHCIYGVDINPMAVELCKISLWMEAMEPGKPLGFLDAQIKCGNSLIGATPELLEQGVPDDAFKPVIGDDKTLAGQVRSNNKIERKGQTDLFHEEKLSPETEKLWNELREILNLPEDNKEQVEKKKKLYKEAQSEHALLHQKQIANLWTSAFFWPLTKEKAALAPTQGLFSKFHEGPTHIRGDIVGYSEKLAQKHNYFHWHLEFPEVFKQENPGFDCVLGNPPWERIKLQEKEFFASRDPKIANAPNAAARRRIIEKLKDNNPELWNEYLDAKRSSECESHFYRTSEKYPLNAVGDINTYQIFTGLDRSLISQNGRAGIIVPSGIATDDSNKQFFADIIDKRALTSLFDFENREKLFPAVDSRMKFCLFTLGSENSVPKGTDFVFFLTNTTQLKETERHFSLTAEEIELLNPNTRTCPIFRSNRDSELTKLIYSHVPVFVDENKDEKGNPWGISFLRMFDMANDSHLFKTFEQLNEQGWSLRGNVFHNFSEKYVPLYEAKMIWQFNHRFGTYNGVNYRSDTHLPNLLKEQYEDPHSFVQSWYWVDIKNLIKRLSSNNISSFIGFRRISNATNERTFVSSVLPFVASSDSVFLIFSSKQKNLQSCLISSLSSFVFDFIVRQKMGGTNLNYYIVKQLPILTPELYVHEKELLFENDILHFVLNRALELIYTAWDLKPFANGCGYNGPPFKWDEERRFLLRCELDAAYFHLYLGTPEEWQEKGTKELLDYFSTPRDAVDYIMETFPIVKRKDIQKYEEYRTKRVILEIYDEMAEAMRTGKPYQTRLDPPPADPRVAHEGK